MSKSRKLLSAAALASAVVGVLFLYGGPAWAGTVLNLSPGSGDMASAENLEATLTFEVVGNTLMLQAANRTEDPLACYISGLFFNATQNVTGLRLVEPSAWTLRFQEDGNPAVPFGSFDVALIGGVGSSPSEIAPGESLSFMMSIQGQAPFAATDFTTELSYSWCEQTPSHGTAKCVRRPREDSARGNAVPEPMTISFVGAGLLGRWLMSRCRSRSGISARRA